MLQKKKCIDYEAAEEQRNALYGHALTAWWVQNSIDLEEGDRRNFNQFLRAYGIIDTPTPEMVAWDRQHAIDNAHAIPEIANIAEICAPARRLPKKNAEAIEDQRAYIAEIEEKAKKSLTPRAQQYVDKEKRKQEVRTGL